jgi:hypothetical protein
LKKIIKRWTPSERCLKKLAIGVSPAPVKSGTQFEAESGDLQAGRIAGRGRIASMTAQAFIV